MNEHILVVDDDNAFRIATRALLQDSGFTAHIAATAKEAQQVFAPDKFDLVLTDLVMEGMNGIELLEWIKTRAPETPVMMITGYGSVRTAVEAIRQGAYDYITKPCDNDELLIKIRRVLEMRKKDRELRQLREELRGRYSFANIISQSDSMKQVFKLVRQVADTDATVLIMGETGTGKEMLAKAIHYNSPRKSKPFVVITCSALNESLLESELFGHEKGAFTGALRARIGKFEDANGGTVFLDEIGDIPLHLQTKLLRVLQEKEIERVGSNKPLPVDLRVVAATNKDLQGMTKSGLFREDLFYRLNVFPIHLPTLKQRPEDVSLLADHFLGKHRSLSGGRVTSFSPAVISTLMSHHWPGNIRELENVIKRAIIKTEGEVVGSVEIPGRTEIENFPEAMIREVSVDAPFKDYMKKIVGDAESRYLAHMLEEHQGNVKVVADSMDLDRKTVYKKIEEYGIDLARYRRDDPAS
ncbi:MAG: sigma-54 dependent transcriptional regulator [Ignavibacteriales bacterium]|nr:sigma-54 dependent transcriptional regulator [Ignavibacteriales bacterium]